jgi:hypothetical protein
MVKGVVLSYDKLNREVSWTRSFLFGFFVSDNFLKFFIHLNLFCDEVLKFFWVFENFFQFISELLDHIDEIAPDFLFPKLNFYPVLDFEFSELTIQKFEFVVEGVELLLHDAIAGSGVAGEAEGQG